MKFKAWDNLNLSDMSRQFTTGDFFRLERKSLKPRQKHSTFGSTELGLITVVPLSKTGISGVVVNYCGRALSHQVMQSGT